MKLASFFFAALAFITGLVSAWKWLQASKIVIDPGWLLPGMTEGMTRKGRPRVSQPGDQDMQNLQWISAIIEAGQDSSALNMVAARWTAVTVIVTTVSGVLGNLS